jgi:phosphatidate cytidylyltransferase
MSPTREILVLFGALAAVLAVASAVGLILKRRAGGSNATVDNLVDRTNAWWVMVGVMALAFLTGKAGLILVFALASLAALREYLTLAPTRRADHLALVAAFYVVLPVQFWLVATEWYGLFSVFIPVYVFLGLPVLVALRADIAGFMGRVAEIQWGLMIAVYCLSHVPALAMLPIPGYEGRGVMLIAFLVLVVQASDVLQYIWGKLTGRHKVAPSLSPSKTWEGLVGGVASATLLGALLHVITPFSFVEAAILAFVITLCGFFGGLVMSAIKRDRGVKDWGRMIAGHGGVLDRVDSIVFAAPVFFHIVRYFWTV